MTRLLALACPGCNADLEPAGARGERVLCCARCATAVDLAHDGLHAYPVRVAHGLPAGLYWALAGEARIVAFAATTSAVTALGTIATPGQRVAFAFTVPMRELTIAACHAETLALLERPPGAPAAWTPVAGGQPSGVLGRREAERVAHQALITLITRAPGEIHHLEVALELTTCSVLRVA